MFQKSPTFIGLLFLLFFGLFSGNSFAIDCATQTATCNSTYAAWHWTCTTGQVAGQGSLYFTLVSAGGTYGGNCDYVPPSIPCPAAGTVYTGYVPASSPPSNTGSVPNTNDTSGSSYCGLTIDASKSSCPPNTVMPVMGTVATPACIITGTYTGSAAAGGVSVTSPPSGSGGCPTGSGAYSISNGTTSVTGCAKTSSATSSNSSAAPAATKPTGPDATSTTTTNSTSSSTPNATTGGSDTVGTSTTTNSNACGGAGQPACNVNSTCGGAGQPACNTNIGDSTFSVATPTMTNGSFTDKTQGTVPTSGFTVTNYTSAGSSTCPVTDQTGDVFGQSFTLPFSQICQYLDFVHYIVIIAAAIAAMKLI